MRRKATIMPKKPLTITCLLFSLSMGTAGCEPESDASRSVSSTDPITVSDSENADGENTDIADTGAADDTQSGAAEATDAGGEDTLVCEAQPFAIERDAGRLMILQDLSWSMTLKDRWAEAKEALEGMLADPNLASIEYGFDSFPTDASSGCGVHDSVLVDSGPTSRNAVSAQVAAIEVSNGATPLYCAMKSFLDPSYAPGFSAPDKAHFLLVVSDGQPTCPRECGKSNGTPVDPGDIGELTRQLLEAGTKTLAIGFKYNFSDDPEYLTQIAGNGGTGYSDYIPANDQNELEEALKQVAGSVVSCTYSIEAEEASADPNKVNFYFVYDGDETIVKYNEGCVGGHGWTWTDDDHDTIELCKDTCDTLKSGTVDELVAKFGCKTVVV